MGDMDTDPTEVDSGLSVSTQLSMGWAAMVEPIRTLVEGHYNWAYSLTGDEDRAADWAEQLHIALVDQCLNRGTS